MAEKEYVERGAVLKKIDTAIGEYARHGEIVRFIADCRAGVIYAPAADVVEVRHGVWVHSDLAATWHGKDECSECHYHTADRVDLSHFNYCPNCGAKMNGKGEGEC